MATGIPKFRFSLKHKILGALCLTSALLCGAFLWIARERFAEDKRLAILDLNLAMLEKVGGRIEEEIRSQIDVMQDIAQMLVNQSESVVAKDGRLQDPAMGIQAVALYHSKSQNYRPVGRVKWDATITPSDRAWMDAASPQDPIAFALRTLPGAKKAEVLSVMLRVPDANGELYYLLGDFRLDPILRELSGSESIEFALFSNSGTLIASPYGDQEKFSPALALLRSTKGSRRVGEFEHEGQSYLGSVSPLEFPGLLLVSQIKKRDALSPIYEMTYQSWLLAAIGLFLSILVGILFARSLTHNIQLLSRATERIGAGDFEHRVEIDSYDETSDLADRFNLMADRVESLIKETERNAVVKEELKTASLVQAAFLTSEKEIGGFFELKSYYSPATDIGGDIWDSHQHHHLLTLLIGDATGHGAAAALVTAVAKSCFATMHADATKPIPPEQVLEMLNRIMVQTCHGQLLMTMCIIQIDLATGEGKLCSAGHEAPFRVPHAEEGQKSKPEPLFARGERLGFSLESQYRSETFQIEIGDTILLYTDGVTEAANQKGEQWEERKLRQVLKKSAGYPLARVSAEIVKQVNAHMGRTAPADDITYVLFRWKKKFVKVSESAPMAPPPLRQIA